MAMYPSQKVGGGTVKIAEITANKNTDTYTQDTTYHRYMCIKTLSGVTAQDLRNADEIYIHIVGLTQNNIDNGIFHFKISDIPVNSFGQTFLQFSVSLQAYGQYGYYSVQAVLQPGTGEVSLYFIVGDALFPITDGIKLIFYK